MNQDERVQIGAMILGMAEAMGRQLTEAGIKHYLQFLDDIDTGTVVWALQELIKTESRMPTVADIRRIAKPEESITVEHDAIEASNRIVQAMGKYGWINPEQAKEFIGELGWAVVQREGGWRNVCEHTKTEDLPITKAQWRNLAKAIAIRARAGVLNSPPGLPKPTNEGMRLLGVKIDEVLKDVPGSARDVVKQGGDNGK